MHHHLGETRLLSRKSGRQDSAHRADPTVQAQLTQQHGSADFLGWKDPLCREHRSHDCKIELRPSHV
jgi:hypothetical protein